MSVAARRAAPLLLLAAAVVLVRWVLVGAFGSAVPFWDQWDAEAATWLKPWVEGGLTPAHLLAAHNEHRIGWSRLWSLLWFEANGGRWDNLVVALANALLSGALAALLYGLLRDGLASRAARGVFFVAVLLLAVLPFGWENLLVGFQSQFQFLALFALLLLAAAARLDDRPRALPVLWGLALLGLPTMATGVLAPVAAGGVIVLRAMHRQWRAGPAAVAVGGLALIAIGGLLAVPVVDRHAALRPDGIADVLHALGQVLGWPTPWGGWMAPLLWLPTLLAGGRLLRRQEASRQDWIAIGLAAWVLLQIVAIVWSRGQDLQAVSSRYTDLLAFGTAVNLWLALRAVERRGPGRARGGVERPGPAAARRPRPGSAAAVAVLCGAATLAGLAVGLRGQHYALHDRSALSVEQRANVREFLAGRDPRALDVPHLYIPYPKGDRLANYLVDPTIAAMLPATLSDRPDPLLGRLAEAWRRTVRPWFHDAAPAHPDAARRWRLPVAAEPAEAFPLVEGVQLDLTFPAPRGAGLVSASLQLGTYGMRLPGVLVLDACVRGECVRAESPLASARDNKDLALVFERPLRLQAGDVVRLRLGARATGHPVAVWLVPSRQDRAMLRVLAPTGPRPELSAHAPRLVLGLVP